MLKNIINKFCAFLIICFFILSFVSNIQAEEQVVEIKVKHGDTLWSIAQEYMKNPFRWKALAEFNNIPDPRKLHVGLTIKIPAADFKESAKPLSKIPATTESQKVISLPKTIIEQPQQTPLLKGIDRDILVFENEFQDLIARDSLIKNQKEYQQIIKTLADAKNELSYNNMALASELFEKAKILFEKLKINVQVETIILKPVKVIQVKGRVDVYNDREKMWIPSIANIDRLLNNNDKIRTGDLSGVTMVLEDGSLFVVRPNSEVEIRRCVYDVRNNTLYSKIKLLRGNIIYTTRDNAPVKTVNEIEAFDSLIEFQGQLAASLMAEGTVKYELYRGFANVLARNEKTILNSGNGLYVFPGQHASQSVKLLPPVTLINPVNNIFSKVSTPELIWQPLQQAEQYLVQIAEDESFYRLVFEQTVRGARTKPTALLDGKYYWRVIPVDSNGFYGQPGEYRNFLIDTIAPRLVIISPIDDQIINDKYVKFQGFTEPGRLVTINHYTIIPDKNGEFSYSLPVKQGTNIICLQASDEAGNLTKLYRLIHADYDLQLTYMDEKAYSTIDKWWIHTFNTFGQIIFNNSVFEIKRGEWSEELQFGAGGNMISFALDGYPFKEVQFIYDKDKPALKSLRITPELRGDIAQLTVSLIAVDASSPLARNAKIILLEKDDPAKRYDIDLVYNSRIHEYYGRIEVPRTLLRQELILAQVEVSDIAGNKTVLSEETLGLSGKPSYFWDRIKTNYKQLGLPLFILSGGGIFFSL